MYLTAAGLDPALTRRLFSLNPFYMALAELRIARNLYLTRDYRRELVAEARRCLAHGRDLSLDKYHYWLLGENLTMKTV